MTPTGKKYKKEYAKELVKIAAGDLESARALHASKGGRKENACYLVQQSVEKCLKAGLCHLELPVVHTHDLEALVNLFPHQSKPPRDHQLGALTEYATVRRYEEGYELLSDDDVAVLLDLGKQVLVWAKNLIQ